MTRRVTAVVVAAALATAGTAALVVIRERARSAPQDETSPPRGLALVVVRSEAGPLPAVVGSTGFGEPGALLIPPDAVVVVPGQGESTVAEAVLLPPRQASTAIGNLLGVWIEDHAVVDASEIAALAEEAGGLEIGGEAVGRTVVADMVGEPGAAGVTGLSVVLQAMLSAEVDWASVTLIAPEHPGTVIRALSGARASNVVTLEAERAESGALRASPEQVARALVAAFGGPAEPATPVIVLNGNGVPGIGEQVAERLLLDGFRVAVSQNASEFDHRETLIVVGSADDVALGERVRDLLGVGSVSVSVGSGIAPVTIVVGEDFTG